MKTGLIESPNPDLFQVYCDLAKDITGFTDATFSLYDGEMQCAIAMTGRDPSEKKPGDKGLRTEHNICSYVLLDTEPLLMHDISRDPVWKAHPNAESWGYAGFPVINKDNFEICNIDKLSYSSNTKSFDHSSINNYQSKEFDIADPEMTDKAIIEFQPDYIIHLAAETHVDRSIDNPRNFIQSNIVGCLLYTSPSPRDS